jgi:hypothetical protein
MRRRRYFVGLIAALMAASGLLITAAAPAGAASTCDESMNPAASGNASGLIVSCVFSAAGVSPQITITDYADAVWHYGQGRTVAVSVTRTGTAPGTVTSGALVKVCPDNNTTAATTCFGAAASDPPGQLHIGGGPGGDINHSIENLTSSATLTGALIAPGSFIKTTAAGTATLSKAVLAAGWPNCPGTYASGCASAPVKVLLSNDTGRAVTDGVTNAGSACVSSVVMNFKAADVGSGLSGGDLPDGSTISAFPGTGCGTATTSVNLVCTGCVGGFTGVTSHTAQVLTISPSKPPSSSRYVTDGTSTGTRVLSSATAEFAPSDVGMPIVFNPPIATLSGARVGSIAADGSTATIAGAGVANIPAGAKKFIVGFTTKTAPATGDSVGTLAILLQVNPQVSPTSPPCAANKISGFQIPLSWRNPQGTVALAANTPGAQGYNTFVGGTHLSGSSPSTTSIAQLDFRTASTSFSGYVRQNYTTTASVQGPSTYGVYYTFLPVGVGICPGTGTATSWTFFGLSKKIVENPSFTGGGGGGTRGIKSEPQGTSQVYTGGPPAGATTGAFVVTAAGEQPSNNNACTVSSPATITVGC